jgi:hypothetical protein
MFPFGSMLVPDYEGGGGSFTPFDVPGLIAWYNSENCTLSGSDATSFIDISAVIGDAFPQPLPGQAPTVNFGDPAFNGAPSFNWSNVAGTAVDTPIFTVGTYTIFQVCLITDSPTYLFAFSAGDYTYGGTGYSIYTPPRPGSGGLYDAGDVAAGAGWAVSAAPQVFTRRFDGTALGDTLRINGVDKPITLAVSDDAGLSTFSTWVSIMSYWTGGVASATGKWGATLIYDNAVSNGDRDNVEAFLTAYYAL